MAELSDVLMMKALEDDNGHDTWGSAGFLWVILIFLFFLAFSGGGLVSRVCLNVTRLA